MIISLLNSLGLNPLLAIHWILAVSATLFVLDVFFQTEFLSWIALVCFAAYFSVLADYKFDLPVQWSALIFIIFLSLALFLHYACWRKFLSPAVLRLFMKNAAPEIDERAVGEFATFRVIGGNRFAEWNGELWGVDSSRDLGEFSDGEKVKILKKQDGKIII